MKRFAFPLERVLNLRRTQCRLEESKLEDLHSELRRTNAQAEELSLELAQAEESVRSSPITSGRELASLDSFRMHIMIQQQHLKSLRGEMEQRIHDQTATVIRKRRDVRLLEKLRQTKHKEWTREGALEVAREAEELFLGRWRRI